MLRVTHDNSVSQTSTQDFLRVEENKKHVSVFSPGNPAERNNALAPKVYQFDSVFTDQNSQVRSTFLCCACSSIKE